MYQLVYISIENWEEKEWVAIVEAYPELSNSFYEVLVAYDFPESSLMPIKAVYNDDSATILNAMFGIKGSSSIISESVTGWQLNNIYIVPTDLKGWVQQQFPSARFWHQYSLGVRYSTSSSSNGTLLVDFRKEDFVVIATGRNNILLTQTFEYNTPADVLYYLIKICNQFTLSRKDVELQLSGLIDQNSALYKDLYQYFINIDFRNATWNTEPDYPAHFFTSLNDLAKCAS